MSERDLTFRGLLIESYMAEGLTREAAEASADAVIPPPPDESTIEGWLRARFLEIETNLVVYGQHPPPPVEERPTLEGIWPVVQVVDWMPEGQVGFFTDPRESIRKAIDQILHDPLWPLDRVRVPTD